MTAPNEPLIELARVEGQLKEALKGAVDQPTKMDLARTKRRAKRTSQTGVAIAAFLGAVAVLISIWNTAGIAKQEVSGQLNQASIESLQRANDTLRDRGLPQIPLPQPGDKIDTNALVQAAAAIVLADIQGDPRFKGPQGASVTGPSGAPCAPTTPECRGPSGEKGSTGVSGVPGAPCDPEDRPECRGPQGQAGINGQNGENGGDGTNGNPGQGFDPNNRPHYEGTKSNCTFVLTYINPPAQDRIPYPGGPCPEDPVVTTEPPIPTTTEGSE